MTPETRAQILAELKPGASVFVQGAIGEPPGFIAALTGDPERAAGVEFTACLIPGMNRFDYTGLHPTARLTTFMAAPMLQASIEEQRTSLLPLCYSQTAARVGLARYDLAVFQVTPPDADGECSFGVSGDFMPLAWKRAKRRLAFINPSMPRPPRAETIPFAALDQVIEFESNLTCSPQGGVSPVLEAISRRVAGLVPNGAVLQTGVGGAPGAVLAELCSHKDLIIASGMVTEGYRRLFEAGALASTALNVTGVAYGDEAFYRWLAQSDLTAFASVKRTHDAGTLGRKPRFTAINSALEVDLFGQANLEHLKGRAVSGVGGAPDFSKAASSSKGGQSIIALGAAASPGGPSRIVAKLQSPMVSLARHEVDVVVTEHGAAHLRTKTADERAEALIAIADPAHRSALMDAWRDLSRQSEPARGPRSS